MQCSLAPQFGHPGPTGQHPEADGHRNRTALQHASSLSRRKTAAEGHVMLLDKQGLMQGDCHWSGAMKISGRMQLSMANGLSSSRPLCISLYMGRLNTLICCCCSCCVARQGYLQAAADAERLPRQGSQPVQTACSMRTRCTLVGWAPSCQMPSHFEGSAAWKASQ